MNSHVSSELLIKSILSRNIRKEQEINQPDVYSHWYSGNKMTKMGYHESENLWDTHVTHQQPTENIVTATNFCSNIHL